jgi:hypothetical protein
MTDEEIIGALDLAVTNAARIEGIVGRGNGESNRDVAVDLSVEESAIVIATIKEVVQRRSDSVR